ncbi:polysaccharide lyase 6 family protein [soil metagenome]
MHKILLFLLLLSSSAFAQTQFYVSPAGDNSAAGTLLQPWKTAQYALDHALPGSTIFLMGGAYHENLVATVSGTANNGVTLTSYAGQAAVIDGEATSGDYLLKISGKSYFSVHNLEFKGLTKNNACAILIEGNSAFIEIRNNKIHDINFSSDPADPVLMGKSARAIAVSGIDPLTATSTITISANEIYSCRTGKNAAVEISGNADSFVINRNKIHDITNSGIGIIAYNGTSPDAMNDRPKNGLVSMNTVYQCVSLPEVAAGILIDGALLCRIENNSLYWNTVGIMVYCSAVGKSALSIHGRDNVIYNNIDAGIIMGGSVYPIGCGSVAASSMQCNTLFENNISGSGAELILGYTNGADISSNIIDGNLNTRLLMCDSGNLLSMNFNLFYCQSIPEFKWNGTTSYSFSAWQNITQLDSTSLYINPQMINPVGANFHLEMNSPAIDRGDLAYIIVNNEVDMDTMTRVQDGRVDIGADEYGTAVGIAVAAVKPNSTMYYDHSGADFIIYFRKPQQTNAKIFLSDASGKTIAAVDTKKGDTSVKFSNTQLASGVYFTSINGETLKIVL